MPRPTAGGRRAVFRSVEGAEDEVELEDIAEEGFVGFGVL